MLQPRIHLGVCEQRKKKRRKRQRSIYNILSELRVWSKPKRERERKKKKGKECEAVGGEERKEFRQKKNRKGGEKPRVMGIFEVIAKKERRQKGMRALDLSGDISLSI